MRYFLALLFLLFGTTVLAKTIPVGANRVYKNVTAGLHAAMAGDTVLVDKGHYKEKNLVIRKSIILKGSNYPVLDGEKKYEVISITAKGAVVEGFKIVHSGISSLEDLSGIKVYDANNVVIKNNVLEDTFFGIYIQNGNNCTVEKNKLRAFSKEEQQRRATEW